jgi:neutral ceramidase
VKKPIRLSLRILAGLGVLGGATAIVSLDGVDSRLYSHQPYYLETAARLQASVVTNTLAQGDLLAGYGRARLSPTVNCPQVVPAEGKFRSLPLAGYGSRRGKPARGVHDDIYVKALALKVGEQKGVFVGTDTLIIPPEVTEMAVQQLQREAGLARGQIYLGATHSHSSLGAWGEGKVAEGFAGGFQPEVRVWFADCIVAAVREALTDLKPAQFGHGGFSSPGFLRNRLAGSSGEVDPEFSYAVVKQNSGKLAVLGVYGAHATVLGSDMMEFSADYPGFWERTVEQATGGLAVFIAGGVGSQAPVAGEKGLAGAERMGQALGKMVIERLSQTPLTNSVTFGMLGLEVDMPPLSFRLSDGIRLRPWLAGKILPARNHSFLQVFRIDDSVWVSTPCDFSGELALGIKDFLRARGSSVVITSFNGDYVGYVIPSRYYHLSGYEPRLMSFFGPNLPDYFEELIRKMALALADK